MQAPTAEQTVDRLTELVRAVAMWAGGEPDAAQDVASRWRSPETAVLSDLVGGLALIDAGRGEAGFALLRSALQVPADAAGVRNLRLVSAAIAGHAAAEAAPHLLAGEDPRERRIRVIARGRTADAIAAAATEAAAPALAEIAGDGERIRAWSAAHGVLQQRTRLLNVGADTSAARHRASVPPRWDLGRRPQMDA